MTTQWRKSTRSEDHGNCVELAALPQAVAIRDSKAPDTPHLVLAPQAFTTLLDRLKDDKTNV